MLVIGGKKKGVCRQPQALCGSGMGIPTRAEDGRSRLALAQRANWGRSAGAACGSLALAGELQGGVLPRDGDGFGCGRRPAIGREEC